jgi:hypothetical protein
MRKEEFAASFGGNVRICRLLFEPRKSRTGETMTMQTMRAAVRETIRDVLMVSSFGFWALLLGFVPVAAIHVLAA